LQPHEGEKIIPVRIALFGGTFDPPHSGHVRAAKAAARKFRLDRVLFIPSGNPPHKVNGQLTPFPHRYAMVALACTEDLRFTPSLLESPTPDGRLHYSVDTVRAARRRLHAGDELFFLIGVDAFLDLPHWKDYRRLLDSVNFIVVSRPGFSLAEIARTIPADLVRKPAGRTPPGLLRMRRTSLYVVEGVDVAIASRGVRDAIRAGRRVTGLVPPPVEQYILKEGLYRPSRSAGRG
jgi:nicotinate-nucleotide adenylyltransferase